MDNKNSKTVTVNFGLLGGLVIALFVVAAVVFGAALFMGAIAVLAVTAAFLWVAEMVKKPFKARRRSNLTKRGRSSRRT